MSNALKALIIGAIIGCLMAYSSFTQFLLIAVCALVGLVVGLVLDGRVNVRDAFKSGKR